MCLWESSGRLDRIKLRRAAVNAKSFRLEAKYKDYEHMIDFVVPCGSIR